MQAHQVDAASGAHLLGGELQDWSDDGRLLPSPALGRLVSETAELVGPTRVLLAGPLAVPLLDAIPDAAEVAVLVRGLGQARELMTTLGARRGTTVLCGSVDRLDASDPYDLVVAIGGPDLLLSPDSAPLDAAGLLTHLATLVSESGALVTDVTNTVGLQRLVGRRATPTADADWPHRSAATTVPELGLDQLDEAVAGTGLGRATVYAAYPAPTAVAVLVAREAATSPELRAALAGNAARAEAEHFAGAPALRDPRDLTVRVVDAGLALALAPSWVVVARHGGDLPASLLIAADTALLPPWSRVATHPASEGALVGDGSLRRDLGAALAAVPGSLLDSRLRHASRHGSHEALRALLQPYAAWLRDEAAWAGCPDRRVFATPANTVVSPDGHRLLDPSWRWAGDVPGEAALGRGLRELARGLVATAEPHPWDPELGPDELLDKLGAMVGLDLPEDGWACVEALESALAGTRRSLPSPAPAVQESLAHTEDLQRTLAERDRQVAWLEGTLRARDRQVRVLERAIDVEASGAYAAVQAIGRVGPALRRRARAAADRAQQARQR